MYFCQMVTGVTVYVDKFWDIKESSSIFAESPLLL